MSGSSSSLSSGSGLPQEQPATLSVNLSLVQAFLLAATISGVGMKSTQLVWALIWMERMLLRDCVLSRFRVFVSAKFTLLKTLSVPALAKGKMHIALHNFPSSGSLFSPVIRFSIFQRALQYLFTNHNTAINFLLIIIKQKLTATPFRLYLK